MCLRCRFSVYLTMQNTKVPKYQSTSCNNNPADVLRPGMMEPKKPFCSPWKEILMEIESHVNEFMTEKVWKNAMFDTSTAF